MIRGRLSGLMAAGLMAAAAPMTVDWPHLREARSHAMARKPKRNKTKAQKKRYAQRRARRITRRHRK